MLTEALSAGAALAQTLGPQDVRIVPGLASPVAELGVTLGWPSLEPRIPDCCWHGPEGEVAREESRGVSHGPFGRPKPF